MRLGKRNKDRFVQSTIHPWQNKQTIIYQGVRLIVEPCQEQEYQYIATAFTTWTFIDETEAETPYTRFGQIGI